MEAAAHAFTSGGMQAASGWIEGAGRLLRRAGVVNVSRSEREPLLILLDRSDLDDIPLQHGQTYVFGMLAVSGTGRACTAASPPFTVEDPARSLGDVLLHAGPIDGFNMTGNKSSASATSPIVASRLTWITSANHKAESVPIQALDDPIDVQFTLPASWFFHEMPTVGSSWPSHASALEAAGMTVEWAVGSAAGNSDVVAWQSIPVDTLNSTASSAA